MVAVSCNPYEESKEHGRPQAAKKSPVGSFLVFGSQRLGMSTVVAAAAFARGIFNLTRTGIAAELTAASEQRLPPVGGRCRIATKRGVQGSEAGAVVSGMRTPLQGVKHTLGTTTRDRAAAQSTTVTTPTLLLQSHRCRIRSGRLSGPSSSLPPRSRKSLWADKVTLKNTKGEPSNGRLAFLRIVSCAERIRVGQADDVGSTPKSWRFPPVRREDLLTAFWGSANQKSLRDGRGPTAADAASRHDPSP